MYKRQTLVGLNSMFNGTWHHNATVSYTYSQKDTKAAAFETVNGESILVYYNPNCSGASLQSGLYEYSQSKMCVNFVYDLNGNRGPNAVGKDMGVITALYPTDSVVVAPMPLIRDASTSTIQQLAGKKCLEQDNESRLPNIEELATIFYNRTLWGLPIMGNYWSSTTKSSTSAIELIFATGQTASVLRSRTDIGVHCIKR